MKIIKLNWEMYYYLNKKLIAEVKKEYSDYRILAISRGGLIPSTMISHQTNQKIDVINVFSYTNSNRHADVIIKRFSAWEREMPKKILIVDDLIDSGNTMFAVWKRITNEINRKDMVIQDFSIKSVVLIDKSESIVTPDFAASKMIEPTWIMFPYERR